MDGQSVDQPAGGASTLRWGVKRSLLDYVSRLGDGRIAWRPGQTPAEFPLSHGTESPQGRRFGFAGGLRLSGHAGMLDVVLEDPAIDLDSGMLLVGVKQSTEPVAILVLGDPVIDDGDHGVTVTYPTPELTPDGVVVFGSVYPEATVFDPVVVRLSPDAITVLTDAGPVPGSR